LQQPRTLCIRRRSGHEALYAKATPSQFWGPFIRINDKVIHKYNTRVRPGVALMT
jgi:hypothetical protein